MRGRKLLVDVCDYTNTIVCPIYDNNSDVSGQATDVFINYERNGWKELTFTIPTKCFTENGEEDNFRLKYIIADYRIRVVTDTETDWYLITKDSVHHEAFSKNVSVTAGHISRLLKNRSLDLEFSDDEGNNVGTATELAEAILAGTGWKLGKVANFFEEDGKTIKIRSLNAPTKTGAFRLIEQVCELFEAKPVYHGEERKVDILPMNPFSELEPGEIPEAVYPDAEKDERFLTDSNVIELHYDRYVKNLTRETDTENISTRLYGYGAYGDYVTKYCSIQTATHTELKYVLSASYPDGTELHVEDDKGVHRYFTTVQAEAGDILIWSMMDMNSRAYIWNGTKRIAYRIYNDTKTHENTSPLEYEKEEVVNYFPFLSDYTYYDKVGLMTDDMFQSVAAYQRDMTEYYKESIEAQAAINTTRFAMSDIGYPTSGYLKLDIESCAQTQEGTKLTIRWSEEYPDGVIFRSDYMNKETKYFQWHVAQALKDNGEPTSGAASLIFVMKKDTDPIQWEKAYLRYIDDRQHVENGKVVYDGYDYANSEGERPKVITLWSNLTVEEGDTVYLFCRNNLLGKLGGRFSEDEGALGELKTQTKVETEEHPTLFVDHDEPLPEITFREFGWCYQYDSSDYDTPGTLYFSWPDRGDEDDRGNKKWKNVFFADEEPAYDAEIHEGHYYYNTKKKTLYHGEDGKWYHLEQVPDETRLANMFGIVLMYCRKRDLLYKGMYENYYYTASAFMPVGNYAMPTAFGYDWLFSTDQDIQVGQTIRLDTTKKHIYQEDDVEHIVEAVCTPYDTLIYPEANDLLGAKYFTGSIYTGDEDKNGNDMVSDRAWRSNWIPIWPNETYEYVLPQNPCFIVLYDANRNYLSAINSLISQGEFTTSVEAEYSEIYGDQSYVKYKLARYMRIVVPSTAVATPEEFVSQYYVRLKGYDKCFFRNDKKYLILDPITHEEDAEPTGINSLLKRFKENVERLYGVELPALEAAQKTIKDANNDQAEILGDILREGYWQDDSYVQGDESRLYNDCLENLKKVAQPEIQYTFDFLDLYGSNKGVEFGLDELSNVEWPDIKITDAAHLIDPELNINQWAYIDKLNKCYDQPWKTTIEINTQLSLMGQHDFKDVMARIAEVASETKAKQQIYSRAENITPEGNVSADKIEGEINTNDVSIVGSGWKTDEKGNMILESADGLAAIKFNGSGLFTSTTKDEYGDWTWKELGTGFGINADSITAGFLRGERIAAHTITADRLMANVGSELDIGSNKALNLYATLDGMKPGGSVKTTDGIIEIYAGSEDPKEIWQRNKEYQTGATVIYNVSTDQEEDDYWVCLENHVSGDSFEYSYWKKYNGFTPAVISVRSGGQINLLADTDSEDLKEPPTVNIASGGAINMASGAEINMLAGSDINIASTSSINLLAVNTDDIPEWAINISYSVGDKCKHEHVVYVCNMSHTSPDTFVTQNELYTFWVIDEEYATKSKINLRAGSEINLESGSNINLVSGANLNVAGSNINMEAGSQFNVKAGSFHVSADSEFTVDSSNFTIDENGKVSITADVSTENGMISGWYIGKDHLGNTLDIPEDGEEDEPVPITSTVGLRAKGSYGNAETIVAWAGSAVPSSASFHLEASGKLSASNVNITGGSIVIGNSTTEKTTSITKEDGLVADDIVVDETLTISADKLIFNNTASTTAQTLINGLASLEQTVQGITEGSTVIPGVTTDGFTIAGNQFTMNSDASMVLNEGSSLVMQTTNGDPGVTIDESGITLTNGATVNGALSGTFNGTVTANENSTLNGWALTNHSLYRDAGEYTIHFANYESDPKSLSPRSDPESEDKRYYMMWLGADYPENSPDQNDATGWAPFSVDNKGNVYATGYCRRYWKNSGGSMILAEEWL